MMRNTIKWNEAWEFYQGDLPGAEAVWERVKLPHTWNAADGQDGGGDYYQGAAWYRKNLIREPEWKQVYIRFWAVSKSAEVWCNGSPVGAHAGGFSAFTLDLTPYLRDGENEIRVRADNGNEQAVYPRQADFTFFGGIYRDVELLVFAGDAHFDVERFGTDAVFVTPSAGDGHVKIETFVSGGDTVYAEIYDAQGNRAAKSEPIETGSAGTSVRLALDVPGVHRWHGCADPYLYRAVLCLYEGDTVADRISADFGFRDFSVSAAEGFFLNGVSYPLHGVCRHQDREDMGWAITETEHLEDMALIREIGANTIRLAHYQQAPFFYDLCDRNGMVVWAEIPFISVYDAGEAADENLRHQLRELILQNYNHPSICFWGLANELGIGGESEAMYEILRELHRTAKELDPTRLTAVANVGMTKPDSELFHISDLTSYNEYMGWYEGTADDHGAFCDERHGQMPDIPLAVSEYGAESILRWHSADPKVKDYTEEYQALVHEKAYAAFEKRPYLWATWLWNMFDFASDARDEGGCKGRNNKGLVTFDRAVKKQAFYFYKACWSAEPFVYLCGKRFGKRAGNAVDIRVYSNRARVELWVNGRYAGGQDGTRVFEFKGVALDCPVNEILAKTPEGCTDMLILERVEQFPGEYVYKEEKQVAGAVAQWFAKLSGSGGRVPDEITVREGYLSVDDSMDEIYRYEEGRQAVRDLIAAPLALADPAMAKRLSGGSAMTFTAIWHHIRKQLPDELYGLLNERLNKIKK